ncbi:MAG: nucleotidyl transferase AbiEii/AbiGii toxin family protein [Nanoarchaeota archaeon]
MIPLSLRIKKSAHRKIAQAQDIIVEEVYKIFSRAVFHGGTAIWRCYLGKRFSEDLDFYLPDEPDKIRKLFENIEKRGLLAIKKKISANSVYSEFEMDREAVRLEATYQKTEGHIVDYETADGNIISVYSLTPEEFVMEKVETYIKRRKIRDLYDIFFLIKLVKDGPSVKRGIGKLITSYQSPLDEEDLKAIILEGITPTSKEMIEYIQRKRESERKPENKRKWENTNT